MEYSNFDIEIISIFEISVWIYFEIEYSMRVQFQNFALLKLCPNLNQTLQTRQENDLLVGDHGTIPIKVRNQVLCKQLDFKPLRKRSLE